MILAAHNAHLKEIHGPSVPADPKLGIVGSPETVKWKGDLQAQLDDDSIETVQGNARVNIQQTIVTLPQNLPVQPAINDVLILKGMRQAQPLRLVVRDVQDRFWLLGFVKFICRVS